MRVDSPRLVEALGSAGASAEGAVVRFPSDMVQWAIETAPKDLMCYGRAGQELRVGGERTEQFASPHTNAVKFLDFGALRLRDSRLQDVIGATRIAQALPEISRLGVACYPWDVREGLREVRCIEALLTHSDKHLTEAPQTVREAELWFEALELVSDEPLAQRPVLSIAISPRSPMALSSESAALLMACVPRRVPIMCAPCPMAGGTSPYTVAGTIMQQNAESLCMITIVQLLAEGCPVIYGGAAGPLDIRTGSLSYGAQERNLILGATMDLGRWYGFPRYSPAGSVDSPWPDVQIGLEKMATMLTRTLSGAQMSANLGSVYNGIAISLEQMVIDAEIFAMCRRIASGIEVSDQTLGLEAVLRVGHSGQFLMDEHTVAHMRNQAENLLPELSNRAGESGAPMLDAAHAKVERILAEGAPVVPTQVADRVRAWAEEKAREHAK